jgi:hypothetical protein
VSELPEEVRICLEELSRDSGQNDMAPGESEGASLPKFPELAWRGLFDTYRKVVARSTEASDIFHFAGLWANAAARLGRRIWYPFGMKLRPNVYIVCFGPTGDRKTTATRQATEIGTGLMVISGSGSGEGLAEEISHETPGEGVLIHAEELSQILKPGRWDGSTLIPTLTQCFDCPEKYEMKFRKSPISLDRPTPNILAGVTPEWFWRDFRVSDFQGGFGNRMFFLTGSPKRCIPRPELPDLAAIGQELEELAAVESCQARLDEKACELWDKFYMAWREEEMKHNDSLFHVAVKRVPSYVLKLAMLYAASERTLPEIHADQLSAAILVGRYGAECAKELLSLQHTATNPRKELEGRILAYVRTQNGKTASRRHIRRAVQRYYRDVEDFNRALDSLVRAEELFVKRPTGKGPTWISTEELD